MRELLTDFQALKEHVKDCGLKYMDAVVDYYAGVGERRGFTVVKGSTVIRNAHNFGRLDLAWVEPNVVFAQEYGRLEDIYQHLWKIMVLQPAVAVLLLSGNSQCKPEEVKQIVEKTPQLKDIEFIVLDVTNGRTV